MDLSLVASGLTSPFRQPRQYLTPTAWELIWFQKMKSQKVNQHNWKVWLAAASLF